MAKVSYEICDRCKKEMNYRKGWTSKLFGCEEKHGKFKAHLIYCGNMTGYNYLDRYAELCVDCTNKLINFLNGKEFSEMGE